MERIETTRDIVICDLCRRTHAEACTGFGVVMVAVDELETSGILGSPSRALRQTKDVQWSDAANNERGCKALTGS
jgi:hypothetical protein